MIYAADGRWWHQYGGRQPDTARALRELRGELWAAVGPNGKLRDEWQLVPEDLRERIQFIEVDKDEHRLCVKPGRIGSGGNSGHQAIGLAYAFGARRIVLLGYDMQRTDGETHHHGNHAGRLPNGGNFHEWRERMNDLAIDLRRQGVTVHNATRQTALKCFERVTAQDIFAP